MPTSSDSFFPYDESITIANVSRIAGILQRVKDRRLMLNAKIDGVKGLFLTAILEINSKKNLLVLDELSPVDGHRLVSKNTTMYLSAMLDGVDIHIPITVNAIKKDHKGSMYHASLPEQIVYRQRRQHFRVQPHSSQSVTIDLLLDDNQFLEGQVADISISGVGAIVLETEAAFSPQQGDVIASIIRLPDETLETDIEIRFVAPLKNTGSVKIGAKFMDLENTKKRAMERIITQLQREQLQKR